MPGFAGVCRKRVDAGDTPSVLNTDVEPDDEHNNSGPATRAPRCRRLKLEAGRGAFPPLFATQTHLLGWQGMTATLPANWNLASFGGGAVTGTLRVDDEDGPRLELRWEQPRTPDLEHSVSRFVDTLARQAKKQKQPFTPVARPRLVSKSRRGEASGRQLRLDRRPRGGGRAWLGRVVALRRLRARDGGAHHRARARAARKIQRLAGEILTSLECHGSGGWQTWSVFGLRVEVPRRVHPARRAPADGPAGTRLAAASPRRAVGVDKARRAAGADTMVAGRHAAGK